MVGGGPVLRRKRPTRFRVPLQALKISPHLRGDLITQIPVFFECLVNDVFEFGRQVRVEANRRNGCAFENGVEYKR